MYNIKTWKGLAQLFQDLIHTHHSLPSVFYRKQENTSSSNAWIKAHKQQTGPLFWNSIDVSFPAYFLFFYYCYFYWDTQGASAEERGIDITPFTPQINNHGLSSIP